MYVTIYMYIHIIEYDAKEKQTSPPKVVINGCNNVPTENLNDLVSLRGYLVSGSLGLWAKFWVKFLQNGVLLLKRKGQAIAKSCLQN
jgi:hypothetical protein